MNHKRLRILFCAVGCACILGLLALALLAPNTSDRGVEDVLLSVPSGFYDHEFDLALLGGGNGTIHYTLDSSDPDQNSPVYEGPIHISDASLNPNRYSMNTDVAVDFYGDLLEQSGRSRKFYYEAPSELIDKCTVVRAVCYDDEGRRGNDVVGTYFVGFDEKLGYDGMYIVSIATDPDNLFDYYDGIYVTGQRFANEALTEDGLIDPSLTGDIGAIPGNYGIKNWEKGGFVTIFNPDREQILHGLYGVGLQGNSSRGRLPKGINIYAREMYGDKTIPAKGIFGDNFELGSLNLQPVVQSMDSKMNDYLGWVLSEGLDVGRRPYVPCELFLEGEYWGVYWIVPRYEKEFFRNNDGIDGDNVAKLKLSPLSKDTEADYEMYLEMLELIAESDMNDPEVFARARAMMDYQSCLDYYAFEIYIGNEDWPVQNTALWRSREVGTGPYADGKWRWILYDLNWCMLTNNAEDDYITRTIHRDPMFEGLMSSDIFARDLKDRLVYLAQNNCNPQRVRQIVDWYESFMVDAMENEYIRFYGGKKTVDDFNRACERIYEFFARRHDFILQTYGE